MPIKTVLLAVGSGDEEREEALAETVIDLLGGREADVVVFHVLDEEEFDEARRQLDFGPETMPGADEVARRNTAVVNIKEMLDDHDLTHDIRGAVSSDPGGSIVELAADLGADLVVVGGRRRSPAGKALLGSTAQYVLMNAPCPVTFVRGDRE